MPVAAAVKASSFAAVVRALKEDTNGVLQTLLSSLNYVNGCYLHMITPRKERTLGVICRDLE